MAPNNSEDPAVLAPVRPAPNAGAATRAVLLVEPDHEVAHRLVEAIWAYPWLQPIQVEDLAQAESALESHRIDAVVCEAVLPDGNGFRLLAQLRRDAATRDLPFLFLADDDRIKAKVAAFRMGAHDYLVKPVAVGELCARIAASADRVAEARVATSERGFSLAGNFTGMSFPELVGLLNCGRRSGRLSIETPRARGQLVFVEGQVFHVSFGDGWGEESFFAILRESEGRFEFLPEDLDRNMVPNTVALSPTALLVEGARRLDEAIRNGSAPAPKDAVRAWESPAPAPEIAESLREALRNEDSEIEISVRDASALEAWSADPEGGLRILGCIVGEATRFGGWLREIGEFDPDELLASALVPGPQVPCVSWTSSDGHRLDLLMLDHRAPAAVLEALHGELAIAVIAPPNGRWRDLGIRARAELSSVVARLEPRAVFGVGDAELETGISELLEQLTLPARCEMMSTADGLLDWLGRAIECWARQD